MRRSVPLNLADLRGYSQLAVDATVGVADLVEAMHQTILQTPGPLGMPTQERTRGVTGLVYKVVRGVTRGVGFGIDQVLRRLPPAFAERASSAERETILAALNGVLGDHLQASGNPLCIEMELRHGGRALDLSPLGLAAALPASSPRLLLLVHGLCMGERQWQRRDHEHGAALAAALGCTVVHVNYNSGLHVAANGRELAAQLEALVAAWPQPLASLDILGYSMGGLVARSACHYGAAAGHGWLPKLRRLVFLGTPHHGAPLERGGNWVNRILDVSPYTAAFSRLAKLRSAGITDLRHGAVLDPMDTSDAAAPDRFAAATGLHPAPPLPAGVECHALAGVIAVDPAHPASFFGDGLVPRASALGQHPEPARCLDIPESRQWVGHGLNHLDLLDSPAVFRELQARLG